MRSIYKQTKKPGTRENILVHRLIWEKHHGPIPPKMDVHHKDGNVHNNKLSNLQLVTRIEHRRLHSKAWRKNQTTGGLEKKCSCCKKWKAETEYQTRRAGGDRKTESVFPRCRLCVAAHARYKYATDPKVRKERLSNARKQHQAAKKRKNQAEKLGG